MKICQRFLSAMVLVTVLFLSGCASTHEDQHPVEAGLLRMAAVQKAEQMRDDNVVFYNQEPSSKVSYKAAVEGGFTAVACWFNWFDYCK